MTNTPADGARFIRCNVILTGTGTATVSAQLMYEKRGWRRLWAILRGKPVVEWVDAERTCL